MPSWSRHPADLIDAPPVDGDFESTTFLPDALSGDNAMMPDREFEALVQRLQRASAAHPRLYRLRVVLLAALGYGFLVGTVIAMGLAAIGILYFLATEHIGALSVKVVGPLAALIFIMLRALWVRVPPPTGLPVTAERAPGLFALLKQVRGQVNGPRIHRVLMNDDFNASIVQVPRLGVLGWQENFLVLGLPLMLLLPAPEFRAVVAHEMGHLVGGHGRFGIWVYRQRLSWARLLHQLEREKKAASAFFAGFLRWYGPLFNAHTFVMARAHEYEADSLAAAATTPRVAADALTRIEVLGLWLQRAFWPDVQQRMRSAALPPDDVISEMARRTRMPSDPEALSAALSVALRAETASMDTHPSLRARLEALGETAQPPEHFEISAAAEVLGAELPAFEGQLNRTWYDSVVVQWTHLNAEALAQQKRLAELNTKETAGPLSTDERWECACLLSAEGRRQESELLVEDIVAAAPSFGPAQAVWGMMLLNREDERGLTHVDRAIELAGVDPIACCRAAHRFLASRDRAADAERYARRVRAQEAKLAAARDERSTFMVTDAIEPHGLSPSHLQALREALKSFPEVQFATLVRKRVAHFPESPMLVLAVRIRTNFWRRTFRWYRRAHADGARKALLRGLRIGDSWACLALDLLPRRQRRKFEQEAGQPFYRAP